MKRIFVCAIVLLFVFASCYKNTPQAENKDCKKLEHQIQSSITKLNYCSKDDDCVADGECLCPFGSYWLINKNADLSKINKQVKKYLQCQRCEYECDNHPKKEHIKCKKKKCVVEYKKK